MWSYDSPVEPSVQWLNICGVMTRLCVCPVAPYLWSYDSPVEPCMAPYVWSYDSPVEPSCPVSIFVEL